MQIRCEMSFIALKDSFTSLWICRPKNMNIY